MDYQWGSLPSGTKKERRGKRAELPDDVAKKLKSCSVMGCEEWRDLNSHTTYHCFPTGDKNQQRWEIWTSLLQKSRDDEAWIPFRGSLVCSHHFNPSDFVQDPNQKRRKLVKNAIPSIFPTFSVDLDDPSFILDDSNDASGTVENGGENVDINNGNNDYYYDDEDQGAQDEYGYDDQGDQGDEADFIPAQVQAQYEDDEDMINEEEDLQYVTYQHPPRQRMVSKPLPKLTPARSFKQPAEYQNHAMEPPPKKKLAMAPPTTDGLFSKKPQLSFKGTVTTASTKNSAEKFPVAGGVSSFGHGRSNSTPSSSKLYQQLCKSMPNTKFPMSWNSDLEIEVVESNSKGDSTALLKKRVQELETENELLKNKFGAQIRALQRKIKEQDKIINDYVLHFSSVEQDEDS
ncbi:uncharacterized protein LOC110858110 isoform X2 [Folsomia candida]|uniref:DNA transposase THAP9 n=1 Tax=Folsomia candida TaxID=158441 RepID=A0A226EVW1_FOLCA|nr:uncharacterized protein LOC110858110 isoform X2 [Folsomia candida]OXA61743.1 DNA transposase THAP9 [Folsomia candida]